MKLREPVTRGLEYKELEEHTAESKWQYCNCQSCQENRYRIEQIPGPKINWDKVRLKDEKY